MFHVEHARGLKYRRQMSASGLRPIHERWALISARDDADLVARSPAQHHPTPLLDRILIPTLESAYNHISPQSPGPEGPATLVQDHIQGKYAPLDTLPMMAPPQSSHVAPPYTPLYRSRNRRVIQPTTPTPPPLWGPKPSSYTHPPPSTKGPCHVIWLGHRTPSYENPNRPQQDDKHHEKAPQRGLWQEAKVLLVELHALQGVPSVVHKLGG